MKYAFQNCDVKRFSCTCQEGIEREQRYCCTHVSALDVYAMEV